MEQSYWSAVLGARQTRRRALALASAGSLSILLAACGDSKEADKASSLATEPSDTSKQAKRGGVLKWFQDYGDPPSFEPANQASAASQARRLAYNRLIHNKIGYLKPPENSPEAELAESWEFSPDKTQVSLKLRPGIRFHNKPPLNGRILDAQDVIFSWDRWARIGTNRTILANSANPDAPILSLTAPDSQTVVVKLKQPHSYMMNLLALETGLWIIPREADSTLDVRREVLGTGPFMLSNYTPSASLSFKRHPEYFDKDRIYIEEIEAPLVPVGTTYATGVAQFRAGQIYHYPIKPEEILQLKSDIPALKLFKGPIAFNLWRSGFGWLPEGRSPFIDERVRQAYSMSIDRDAFNDYKYNVRQLQSQGLPVETRWHSAITCDHEGYWLDPRGKDFGPNAKFYNHDVTEAKKLLTAAGFPNGLDVNSYSPANGPTAGKDVEVMDAFANEAGFRTKLVTMDYNTEFLPKYRDGKGMHDGWASKVGNQTNGPPDAIGQLSYLYYSKGGNNFYGYQSDSFVDSRVEQGLVEFDAGKRKTLVEELQRYLAQKQYYVNYPGGASGFNIAWPVLGNFNVYHGGVTAVSPGSTDSAPHTWWIDDTQAPLKKA